MPARTSDVAPPSDDKRWRIVNATMRRHGYTPHALIESLHSVQESFGFLDEAALRYVSASLHVPLSQAFGVATFYHFFSLKPPADHSCVVCLGTACYIKGSGDTLSHLSHAFHVPPGETTADGSLALLTAHCVGACGLAPVVVIDSKIVGDATGDAAVAQVKERLNGS